MPLERSLAVAEGDELSELLEELRNLEATRGPRAALETALDELCALEVDLTKPTATGDFAVCKFIHDSGEEAAVVAKSSAAWVRGYRRRR